MSTSTEVDRHDEPHDHNKDIWLHCKQCLRNYFRSQLIPRPGSEPNIVCSISDMVLGVAQEMILSVVATSKAGLAATLSITVAQESEAGMRDLLYMQLRAWCQDLELGLIKFDPSLTDLAEKYVEESINKHLDEIFERERGNGETS